MREVQVHPLEDNVLHIDFQAVTPDELVSVRIPLTFVGLSREQEKEGSFRTHVRSIPVRCKVKDIPNAIEVNISGLKVEGSSYLGDLDLGAAVRIIGQKNMALATLAKI
jgi:large subunit ribosomal protein L25